MNISTSTGGTVCVFYRRISNDADVLDLVLLYRLSIVKYVSVICGSIGKVTVGSVQ